MPARRRARGEPVTGRARGAMMTALALLAVATCARARGQQLPSAQEPPSAQQLPSAQQPANVLRVPPDLPRYDLAIRIDPVRRRVASRERVWFKNRARVPVTELVFHVYPRYKVPAADTLLLAKTLEYLRLSPEEAMDREGRRLEVSGVRVAGASRPFSYDPAHDTILVVPLAVPLEPGQAVEAELDFVLDLPDKWGRWGHVDGITFLVNWYPVLAFHDDNGWDHTPFVPWHQPWHQEAGHYRAVVDLPSGQVVASTGRIVGQREIGNGQQRIEIETPPARDFALVCSDRFQVLERQVGPVAVRVHAFPEDEENAHLVLDDACEVVELYQQWFGPYFDTEFEVAASFFGWNGNECSGLVLLDRRLFRLPSAGKRYIDHLVTHETCHQWWWNVVGTDGYAEAFMDEGLVNCFSAIRMDRKYGRNGPLITWPQGLGWLPTIGREDLRLASYYGWQAHGKGGPVIQDLTAMGNMENLFSLAYDRGGKVVQSMNVRMGDEAFFGFFKRLYHDHAYGILSYDQFKRELQAYDPQGDWPTYLDNWLVNQNECDWSIQKVRVESPAPAEVDPALRRVSIELSQQRELAEPTILACTCGDQEIRVPIWPERVPYDVPGARVELRGDRYVVELDAPGRPSQVVIDPDHALLDAVPDNNRWKPEVAWRLTPLMTPLDTSSWFQAHDRVSIVGGPFIDQYARGGLRAAAQRINRWQLSGWMGAEPALSEAIFGGEATLLNAPWPMWNAGVYYEEGLYNFHNDDRHSGGRAFLRKRLATSSSFLVDDPGFFELYYGFGNEFWPGDTGRPTDSWLTALGTRFWLNTQSPYWDPIDGELYEVAAEYGNQAYGSAFDYVRLVGQFGVVRTLPERFGALSWLRFALRGYGGFGWPDTHTLFRLGGGNRLRALNLQQDWGSSAWLVTAEVRFPIWRKIDRDMLDHVVHFKNLYGAAFVDVGQSYTHRGWYPLTFGPGVGLRFDVALFSFLERATLRLDLAQPIYGPGDVPSLNPGAAGPVIWFGLNQAF